MSMKAQTRCSELIFNMVKVGGTMILYRKGSHFLKNLTPVAHLPLSNGLKVENRTCGSEPLATQKPLISSSTLQPFECHSTVTFTDVTVTQVWPGWEVRGDPPPDTLRVLEMCEEIFLDVPVSRLRVGWEHSTRFPSGWITPYTKRISSYLCSSGEKLKPSVLLFKLGPTPYKKTRERSQTTPAGRFHILLTVIITWRERKRLIFCSSFIIEHYVTKSLISLRNERAVEIDCN